MFNEFTEYKTSNYSVNKIVEQGSYNLYPIFDSNNELAKINEHISIIKDGAGMGRTQVRPGEN